MRVVFVLIFSFLVAMPAGAAKRHPNHDRIVYDYHRLCDNFVDNEYYGATRAEIKKFCRVAAGYMMKTGDLPSYNPKKTAGGKKRTSVKPDKPEDTFNCLHLGVC